MNLIPLRAGAMCWRPQDEGLVDLEKVKGAY
jgi:hypothetical protein